MPCWLKNQARPAQSRVIATTQSSAAASLSASGQARVFVSFGPPVGPTLWLTSQISLLVVRASARSSLVSTK